MRYFAGIDLGGTFIKCGIFDETGKIINKDKVVTPQGYLCTVDKLSDFVKELAARAQVNLTGVGIGAPGVIESETGTVVVSHNLKWKDVPLAKDLSAKLGLPVFLTNDANAAALGENFCGSGKEYSSMVLLTIGTGIGSGIVINGKLFEGYRSAGAELGHETIQFRGKKCACGRRGCFEVYASASALVKQTRQKMRKHSGSALWKICEGDLSKVDGRTVFEGMKQNDALAMNIFDTYIGYLAEGIANIINSFRPEAVVLGGGISAEGDTLIHPLKKRVNALILGRGEYAPVEIVAAALGNDAGLCGTAKFAKDKTDNVCDAN